MTPAGRSTPRCRPARWLAAVLLVLAAPAAGSAQTADERRPITLQGMDLFRAILHTAKVQPLTLDEYNARGARDDTIVVIIGPPAQLEADFLVNGEAIARQVLREGGAVLYASDTESGLFRAIPGGAPIQVHEDRVWASDPAERHTDNPNSPFLVPRDRGAINPGPTGDLFRGLHRVVTEHPSCLVVGRYGGVVAHALAVFPRSAYFTTTPALRPDPNRNPFAVGGAGPDQLIPKPYRFVALADQAVLMNRLVADTSTDNLDLARRLVHFLKDPDGRNRTHCLFVENGLVVTRFDTAYRYAVPPAATPPINLPSFEKAQQMLVDGGNRIIDRAQEDDTLNKVVLGPESQPRRRQRNLVSILQTLMVVGAVWAVWFMLRRVWRARQPTDVPRPPAIVPLKPGPPGIFTRREQELLRRNNLYEPVRDLLRDFFIAAGAPPDAGRTPSRLVFGATGGKPARLRKAIDELWALAFGRARVVTVYQWQELEPKFELVRQAFEDGAWQFVSTAAATRGGEG